ncbi:hypothetical protein HPB52_016111 [Rhipicephalus sanguineus]|uniref:Uncharacterized protein n=1 Tax=Rhipicephalus sanguineus TaxID=34632 RepID=A0A9D4QE11_RHISA|nr:hypothetical protein HPB52_016111 [Rhipicephalus sanguineus]
MFARTCAARLRRGCVGLHEQEEASPSSWEELRRRDEVAADHNFDDFVVADADTDATEVLDDEEMVQLVSGTKEESEDANDPDAVEAPVRGC